MKFEDLGCILHSKWVPSIKCSNIIIGIWAEDNAEYQIDVQSQLRDQVIYIQNCLYTLYQNFNTQKHNLNIIKNRINDIFSI
jgi:hypothetical protein